MTKKRLAYIGTTAVFSAAILPGAVLNLTQPELVIDMMAKLGLPLHLLTLMGIWKFLGVAALATPKLGRINEWAYAGFFFDLSGAAYLHASVADFSGMLPSIILLCLLAASYLMRDRANSAPEKTATVPAPTELKDLPV